MRSAFLAFLVIALAGPVHGDSIGIFSATSCTGSTSLIASGETVTLYVMADANGFSGAEYRIGGLPPSWSATATMSPQAVVAIGDPFGLGVNIAFGTAQTGCVLLHTIQVHDTSALQNVVLTVVAHTTPSHPQYNCPWLYFDCGPCAYLECVDVFSHTLNPTVSLEEKSWTALKGLYR